MLDVYSEATAQTVTALTTSAQVLDAARPFSGIQSGTWVVYTICGNVDFVFTGTAGNNGIYASVSGVFFGPPPGAASTTNMLVDAAGGLSQVVAETDGSGKLTAYYVRAGDELLEVMRPGGTPGTWSSRFVHHDGLGSVRALTDETGTATDTRGYEAFGTKNASAGSDPLAYGFAGEPLEGTSQLAYHRARWMDSRVGRFAGMDPWAGDPQSPGTLHKYVYVAVNPVNGIDPTGLMSPLEALTFGNDVHKAIYQDFLASSDLGAGTRFANQAISTITGTYVSRDANFWTRLAYGASFLARPDLAFRPMSTVEMAFVFEIKPDNDKAGAEADIRTYLFLLRALDQRAVWRGGSRATINHR